MYMYIYIICSPFLQWFCCHLILLTRRFSRKIIPSVLVRHSRGINIKTDSIVLSQWALLFTLFRPVSAHTRFSSTSFRLQSFLRENVLIAPSLARLLLSKSITSTNKVHHCPRLVDKQTAGMRMAKISKPRLLLQPATALSTRQLQS